MFDFIRSHQRLMQFLLLVLIVPSFALIGVSGYNSYVSGDHDLVKVGKAAITLQEFERARANQLQQMQQTSPGGFDPAVLDNPQVRSALLESLIDYRVLLNTANNERFSVSDTSLRHAIAAIPQFQVEGQFSPERYNEVLASAGMTTRDFEQSQRFELAMSRVLGPVAATADMPAPVVQNLERILTAERTLRMRVFSDADYQDNIQVSDDDIHAWYDANKQEFEVPEHVSVQYLLLNEDAAMANLPEITDYDLEKYYDQNKARYTQPARVDLSHIQVNVPAGATQEVRDEALAQAQKLKSMLDENPDSFADIAKDYSQDAGTARNGGKLGWITQGTWPASLDKAVFSLEKNQISEVIDGPGGYHVFRADDVQPEQVQPLDQLRDTVRQEIRRQLGAERFADMATRLTSLVYDHPDSLEQVAQALGMTLKTADGVGRNGLLPANDIDADAAADSTDAAILNDVRVRRAVFSPQVLTEHHNSGVIEISPDTMLSIRAVDLKPAHIPDFAKVSDRIRTQITAQRAHEAAVKAGQDFLQAVQQLENTHDPEGFGEPLVVSRINPQGLQKPVMDAALAVKDDVLPVYTGVEGIGDFVVLRVESAKAGASNNELLANLSAELTQAWGQAEEQAVLKAMRIQANVEMLPEAQDAITATDSAN